MSDVEPGIPQRAKKLLNSFGAGKFRLFVLSQDHQVEIRMRAQLGTAVSSQRNNGVVAAGRVQFPKVGERRIDKRRQPAGDGKTVCTVAMQLKYFGRFRGVTFFDCH